MLNFVLMVLCVQLFDERGCFRMEKLASFKKQKFKDIEWPVFLEPIIQFTNCQWDPKSQPHLAVQMATENV